MRAELSSEQRAALDAFKTPAYLPDAEAPYHGASHPKKTWAAAEELIHRCEKYGVSIDRVVLRAANEMHDAYSHAPPNALGYPSAEALAADLARHYCTIALGMSQEQADNVAGVILATNPNVLPTTPEQIIMRLADLANVGGDYAGFKEAACALHTEAQNLNGTSVEFKDWIKGSFRYLGQFLWPMLELTPEDWDDAGRSVFHANALRNMIKLWSETFDEKPKIQAEFFPHGQIAPALQDQGGFYVAIHPDQESRRGSLAELGQSANSSGGVAVAVPGNPNAFPLPDEICDEVRCHDVSLPSFAEAVRVAKIGGKIIATSSKEFAPEIKQICSVYAHTIVKQQNAQREDLYVLTCVKDPLAE